MKTEIKDWVMKFKDYELLQCEAPCSLYSVLLDHQLIPDPYYGVNEQEVRDLCEYPCEFSCTFEVEQIQEYMELEFGGLDTICDIYLNERRLDSVKNMHRSYVYDVRDRVKLGTNTIRLQFSSPIEYFRDMDRRHRAWTCGDTIPGAAQLRKALYMSGWDWGPQLPDMGIFRPVVFNQYETDRLEDVEVRQIHRDGTVKLFFYVQTKHQSNACEIVASVDGKTVSLVDGYGEIEIEQPKLWWPNGYGQQPLYEVIVDLVANETVIDTQKKRIGLRTLTVSREPDKYGEEFCFVVNGVKIFAMGANYVPQDNILSRITPEKTEQLIKNCIDANFNCLRVWGGAYYPEEEFYDLCDKYGIIIWQDFMIACAILYLRDEFKETLVKECEEQLKRFRHRACLGLVCGNNEMELAVMAWGKEDEEIVTMDGRKAGWDGPLVRAEYLEFYERLLPDMCYRLAPDVFYWPSSPSCGGEFDDPADVKRGDQHFWGPWNGNKSFTEYREHQFRFCSEFGFESYPSMKTIRTFAEPKDMNLSSRVMDNHQKCKFGVKNTAGYIAEHYLYPSTFEKVIYASQILQAEAIKYGVEHFRRIRGCCMGSLYWQLNDCWPVASWSSVDYYGRYKALHYAAKKFYAPLACALFYEDNKIMVNVANETRSEKSGCVKLCLCRSDFTVLDQKEISFTVEELSSTDIGFIKDTAVDNIYDCYFYADMYDEEGKFLVRQSLLFVPPKHFEWKDPNVKAEICDIPEGVEITLTAENFARYVEVDFEEADVILSDNYIDITSNEPVKLRAKTKYSAEALQKQLILQSVYDIGVHEG